VTSCEPIEFCDSTVTLTDDNYLHNLCPQCQPGYTYFYNDTTKLIEFNKCTPKISKILSNNFDLGDNCLAANLTDCKICKKGASIDSKGFCQNFKDNNCEGSFVEFLSNNFIGEIDGLSITNQAIYWANTKTNCDKCRSTFINISYQNSINRCFTSVERENIVYSSSENSTTARLIDSSSAPISDSLKKKLVLYQTTSIPNCASVDVLDDTVCIICNPNFYLNPLSRTCHQILNCVNQEFIFGKKYKIFNKIQIITQMSIP
jgi:hypothetical protein